MPHTVHVASSCANTRPPALTIRAAADQAIVSHPGQHDTQAAFAVQLGDGPE
ncbi:MAG: hypothetical protein U0992_07710 [Planctomycetaceae bacterium]